MIFKKEKFCILKMTYSFKYSTNYLKNIIACHENGLKFHTSGDKRREIG